MFDDVAEACSLAEDLVPTVGSRWKKDGCSLHEKPIKGLLQTDLKHGITWIIRFIQ